MKYLIICLFLSGCSSSAMHKKYSFNYSLQSAEYIRWANR